MLKNRKLTPEKVRQKLERVSTSEVQSFVESALMLASSGLRNDVPDTEVNLRYTLEQAYFAVYGLEELLARKENGEFLRPLD